MTWSIRRRTGLAAATLAVAMLTGCNDVPRQEAPGAIPGITQVTSQSLTPPRPTNYASDQPISLTGSGASARPVGAAEVVMGTGQFVSPGAAAAGAGTPVLSGSDVTLDFANVDVRDVLKAVLGDLLQLPYVIDPGVQGTITLQTGHPIPRSAVIDVMTSSLQLNGIALVLRDGTYLAVPIASAARQAPLGGTIGFVTRVVTPQYIAATDLERVLEPVLPPGTTLRADAARNLLLITGSARDVNTTINNIAAFDVDYLRGLSFALLPLRNGRARQVAADVNNMLATSGRSIADVVKIMPIERMNAVLVTSMQPAYLQRVRDWVERLDRGDGRADTQLFVYRLQNGRATEVARVLRRALGLPDVNDGDRGPATPGSGGPGSPSGSGGGPSGVIESVLGRNANAPPSASAPATSSGSDSPLAGVGAASILTGGGAAALIPDIRVTADPTNNALIVTATGQDYARVEAAIQKLDITPLQVLIEATVAEVTLTNQLRFGLQYFINSGNFTGIFAPTPLPVSSSIRPSSIDSTFPGLGFLPGANVAYASGGTTIVLQALSNLTTLKVLSSPNLMVLNNGTARLQVGDQVPVATQSATSTLTDTAQTVNSINYRDTGVILEVTPRVNASGLVLLDISEEVSDVARTVSSTLNSPTISQRKVSSTVAVHDGQTIGLAGLIKDSRTNENAGLPWLKDVPIIGWLFGVRGNTQVRTELLVLITPRVIRGREDGDAATRELQDSLRLTVPVVNRRR